jgi:hypothetical protein
LEAFVASESNGRDRREADKVALLASVAAAIDSPSISLL